MEIKFDKKVDYNEMLQELKALKSQNDLLILQKTEQYKCLSSNPPRVDEIAGLGVKLQVDAESIMGKNGFVCRFFSRTLLKHEMVYSIATEDADAKSQCIDYVAKKVNRAYAKKLAK